MTASEHPTDVDPATTHTGRTDTGRTDTGRVDSGRADNHTDSQQSRHLDDLGGQDRPDAVTSAESSEPRTSSADTSVVDMDGA